MGHDRMAGINRIIATNENDILSSSKSIGVNDRVNEVTKADNKNN
jgi:hypothetical protein